MKNFKSILNESQAEDRNQLHMIVLGDENDLEIKEPGTWQQSKIKDYWQRMEINNDGTFEVHIARQKHVNTKTATINWHISGSKHSKQSFNDNLNGLATAKTIANAVLKLPSGKVLEAMPNENAETILAAIDYLPNKCKIFVFKIEGE